MKKLNQRGDMMMLVVIIVAVLAIVGVGFFVWNSNQDDDSTDTDNSTTTSTSGNFALAQPPYTIDVTVTDTAKETEQTLKFNYEAEDDWESIVNTAEGEVRTLYAVDYYYLNSGSNWIRYPISNLAGNSTSVDTYEVKQDAIDEYESMAVSKGQDTCTNGPCTVYELTKTVDGQDQTVKIYVDNETKYIARTTITQGTQTTDIVYTYDDDLEVTPPENYTELNLPNIP